MTISISQSCRDCLSLQIVVESDLHTSENWAHTAEFLQVDVQTKHGSFLPQDEALTCSDVRAFFHICEDPLQVSASILNTNSNDFWVVTG